MWIYGRSNLVTGCRIIDSLNPSAIFVGGTIDGYDTNGIVIERCQNIDGLTGMTLDPVVDIHADAVNVDVSWVNKNEAQQLRTITANNSPYTHTRTVFQLADQAVNNSTAVVSSNALVIPLLPKERGTFKAQIFFTGSATADIKFAMLYPSGATCWYGSPTNLKYGSGDTVSVSNVQDAGSTIVLGTAGTTKRMVEITGFVQTTGTSGDLVVRFAQVVATVADTEILANSSLTFNEV
jgi:hypothetical protein